MRYEVLLTEHAEQDVEDLYAYIAKSDSPKNADYVLERLPGVAENLATSPERARSRRNSALSESRNNPVLDKKVIIYVIADLLRTLE